MIRCVFCNEKFQLGDLAELQDMGESYFMDKDTFICPDCLDALDNKDPSDRLRTLLGDGTGCTQKGWNGCVSR